MTPIQLRQAYDDQLRREGEVLGALERTDHGPLIWALFDHGGFVTYRDLDGLGGAELEAAIGATVAHFRDGTEAGEFEWKTRGHDAPADLAERLIAAA